MLQVCAPEALKAVITFAYGRKGMRQMAFLRLFGRKNNIFLDLNDFFALFAALIPFLWDKPQPPFYNNGVA